MIVASIVTYKTDKTELSTLLNCTVESSVERIYIVDNSPNDILRDFVCEISPKVEYIFGQGNVGYGAAHNIAIRKAMELGAKYHVVINPDIEFKNGTIENLATYMDQNLDVGQVMPRIIYPGGELQLLSKLLPSPMDLIGRRFIPIRGFVGKRNMVLEMRKSGYDKEMMVPFLSGCFMFLRVDVLEKVGGFDDNFFMYCEDIDLCRRIGMSGYKTMFYPKATIIHAHKKESYKSLKMVWIHIKSAVRYFNKWGWFFDSYRRNINRLARQQYE